MSNSLIDKLEELRTLYDEPQDLSAVSEALRIVRQHQAEQPSKIRLTKAEWADAVLRDFKTEGNRTKAEEWEASYAMLFKQMIELTATKRESGGQCSVCGDVHEGKTPLTCETGDGV